MLTESFSKLTYIMGEQKSISDSKTDWPKFAGDAKKFRAWYLSIIAQISIPPWSEFYDSSTHGVVLSTQNTTLNSRLYTKLISVLEGQALQDMISRSHLRANGLLLLQDLIQTYKPINVPEVLAAKAGEFWSKMKRSSGESVDTYYNRFKELLDELDQADDKISTKSAMQHFIFTLGAEFESIQHNYRIGNLPQEWNTTDWPSLLVLCRNYYNSVNPKGLILRDRDPNFENNHAQRMTQQKKVKEWFLNPGKFSKEIEQEQCKYPDQCIYHLTKSHTTPNCNVKRECDKLRTKQNSSTSQVPSMNGQTSHLRHIIEEVFEDAVMPEDSVVAADLLDNDTNHDDLLYFACLSNHFLRLVTNSNIFKDPPRHIMKHPVIADSGANYHMFRDREFFDYILPASGSVYLGDGKTSLEIQGVGTVKCMVGSQLLIIPNVRFVPGLSESIYSLFQHINSPHHRLESSYEEGLFLIFPNFTTKAIVGKHDIYLDAIPILGTSHDIQTQELEEGTFTSPESLSDTDFCCTVTDFQLKLRNETDHIDNLLRELRQYYKDVKMRRQKGLTIPAGFRRPSNHQTQFIIHTPPRKSASQPLEDRLQLLSTCSSSLDDSSMETQINNRSTMFLWSHQHLTLQIIHISLLSAQWTNLLCHFQRLSL
jgi:hypothetical protein